MKAKDFPPHLRKSVQKELTKEMNSRHAYVTDFICSSRMKCRKLNAVGAEVGEMSGHPRSRRCEGSSENGRGAKRSNKHGECTEDRIAGRRRGLGATRRGCGESPRCRLLYRARQGKSRYYIDV